MRLLLAVPLLLAATGCFTVRYETALAPTPVVHERRLDFYVVGLVGTHDVDLDLVCPGGAHAFGTTQTPVETVLALVTLGIYTPRTAFVQCGTTP